MSAAHDELARLASAMVAAYNERDLDTILSLVHEEVAFVNPVNAVEPGTRVGREAFAAVTRAQWEFDVRIRVERTEPAGPARLLTIGSIATTMPGTDAPLGAPMAIRWTMREGLVGTVEGFGPGAELDEVLAQAGLSGSAEPTEEQADGQDTP